MLYSDCIAVTHYRNTLLGHIKATHCWNTRTNFEVPNSPFRALKEVVPVRHHLTNLHFCHVVITKTESTVSE